MTSPHSPSGPVFSAPAKKQLGQHFLADRYYIDKIVMAVNPKDGDRLVEIGPGQGAITLPLLRVHPKMTVIEFDRDLIAPLTAAAEPLGELTIVNRDVLRVDFTELADGQPIRLVGNLPYNISSPILFHALEHAAVVSDMHFMLQKEVVDRMAAGPGSKVFGRLSVMLQAYCEVTSLFVVPPGAFRPPPKVDSAVVRLVPRDPASIDIKNHKRFAEVVKAAFGQRRKTLRNALNNVVSAEQFVAAGVRPDARAEQLDVAEFIALANAT
ncbi:16S rRNA (adenine(1518)-N(6)/adenine(1519)-N(6))-dimethyltransferase RsmA [Stenotrophomonas indicatrix]|uniref:16S rRNA (adenine(1518)-N(6)/adenine(1519)-N(6))- dimethyltransferase RsmA n=1 Tax=Stenotrophomonas indicatrix TaxID=2045451 RepID=UPI0026545A47|nr:16S rRNA (adenine(1518)-N(6)/adenine(1519)-N(6))-dimethyltransferase RsmA [Stenotrophomonas indicatrix]MDN8645856.1 16S rRNA (adenine(1518)-N(6)/adenine(1519)-N(6))-dimethyltransferase RsmA [Stenotrophomonas indicatrix]MDN8657130.1 16S rRNA (adenine(1518)-N(6)/adenine(1519)-N(6))-dimethyltransferase RsmA [Stenotrophomonas indicatrix]